MREREKRHVNCRSNTRNIFSGDIFHIKTPPPFMTLMKHEGRINKYYSSGGGGEHLLRFSFTHYTSIISHQKRVFSCPLVYVLKLLF